MTTTTKRTYNDWSEREIQELLKARVENGWGYEKIARLTFWDNGEKRSEASVQCKMYDLLMKHSGYSTKDLYEKYVIEPKRQEFIRDAKRMIYVILFCIALLVTVLVVAK